MEMTEYRAPETEKTVTAIRGVQRRVLSRRGADVETVTVQTDDGDFTNFMNVWEAQGIDLASVDPGDEIEVEWTLYEKRGREYRNFVSVRPTGKKAGRP